MKSYKVLEVKVEIEQAYNKNYKDAIAKHLNNVLLLGDILNLQVKVKRMA